MAQRRKRLALLAAAVVLVFSVGMLGASSLGWWSSTYHQPPDRPDEAVAEAEGAAEPPISLHDESPAESAAERERVPPVDGEPSPLAAPASPPVEEETRTYEREERPEEVRIPGGTPGSSPQIVPAGPRGRVPGFRPLGRSRYAPVPEDPGKSMLEGVVRDRRGEPVPGADVYRMKPGVDAGGSSVVSFAHLRKIAQTGKDGSFRGKGPGGAYLVTANLRNLLNRRKGLDTSPGVVVEVPAEGTKTGIEIQLPFAQDELGRIEGRIVDPDGEPVRRVEVFVDYFRAWTDRDGRFEFDTVLPGDAQLFTRKTGFEAIEREVAVGPGETVDLELSLTLRDGGSLILAGVVRNTEAEPVAGAYVYIMEPGRTLRSGETGQDGRFEFRGLPDRLAKSGANITVHARGHMSASQKDVPVPSGALDFVLEKAVRARLLFRNELTGEPLPQFRLEFRRTPGAHPFRTASPYSKDGSYRATFPAGRVYLFAAAPDMEPRSVELDLKPGGEEQEIVIELKPSPQ